MYFNYLYTLFELLQIAECYAMIINKIYRTKDAIVTETPRVYHLLRNFYSRSYHSYFVTSNHTYLHEKSPNHLFD